jgi:hypothetical protein
MKFLETKPFNVFLKVPERGGKPANVSDIYRIQHQQTYGLMAQDEKTQRVNGWTLHVIPVGEKSGHMVELTKETSQATVSEYLLTLPEGTVVITSIVRKDYSENHAYRRTAVGFVLVMSTSLDHAEGFYLEVF